MPTTIIKTDAMKVIYWTMVSIDTLVLAPAPHRSSACPIRHWKSSLHSIRRPTVDIQVVTPENWRWCATPGTLRHSGSRIMNTFRNVLIQSERDGVSLGHFNVSNLETLKAVLGAAAESRVPVLVGASEGEREFLGTRQLAVLFRSLREELDLTAFLNADHTHSLAKAVEAAKAGFDSVVIDFSALPFEENVARTKETVEAIKAINPAIIAEGEIGDIGTGSEIHETVQNGFKSLTTPEEAKQFVQSTGIDVLAPAVGNMHGMLKSMVQGTAKKHLNIERISEIKKAAGVFLTLHGGSGTDDSDFSRAIAAGINIIHINTELRVAWRESLEESLAKQPNVVVPYKILPPVIESVKQVAASRLKLFNTPRANVAA
jgi:fructose-bisphosphate aldolase, class II